MNRLVFLVLTCLIGFVFSDATSDLKLSFEEANLSCAARTFYSLSGVLYLVALNFTAAQLEPNHDCYEKCVFQTAGTATPNGLDGNKILALAEIFQPQTVEQTKLQIPKCSSLYDPNNFDCAAAWRLYLCLQNSEDTLNGPSASTWFLVRAAWD